MECLFCHSSQSKGFKIQNNASEHQERIVKREWIFRTGQNAVDKLASVGNFISDANHIEAIFNGLSKEYDTLLYRLPLNQSHISWKNRSLLLAQKVRIEKHTKEFVTASINLARHSKSNNTHHYSNPSSPFPPKHNKANQGYNTRYPHSGRHQGAHNFNRGGRNNWNSTNNNRSQC